MKSWLKSLILKFLWFVGKSTRLHAINKSLLESNYLKLLENKNIKMKSTLLILDLKFILNQMKMVLLKKYSTE